MFSKIRSIMASATVFGYFLTVVPVTCVVGIVYAIIRVLYLKRRKRRIICPAEIMRLLFVCYLTGLISLVVLPVNFWLDVYDGIFLGWWDGISFLNVGDFNPIPSIVKCLLGELTLGSWTKAMLVGNVLMFMPLGFFLPFVTKKINKKSIFIVAAAVPIVVETLQLFLGRSFDIDDLLCNFIGIAAGFFIACAVKAVLEKKKNELRQN